MHTGVLLLSRAALFTNFFLSPFLSLLLTNRTSETGNVNGCLVRKMATQDETSLSLFSRRCLEKLAHYNKISYVSFDLVEFGDTSRQHPLHVVDGCYFALL